MKQNLLKIAFSLAAAVAGTFALTSCSTVGPAEEPLGETTRTTIHKAGQPGGVIVETTTLNATVVGIDATNRAVTVAVPDGRKKVIGCGHEVVNFDQIRVGDRVRATITSELMLALAGENVPGVDATLTQAALAAPGEKPGGVMTERQEYTATVTAINQRRREITLRLPDNTTRSFPVRPDIDLTRRKVGEQVAVRVSVAVAIVVETP